MDIQYKILRFITYTNWIILVFLTSFGFIFNSFEFAKSIIIGGLIVTANFHMLYKTLKGALKPPNVAPFQLILAKYYIRFTISGFIIFILIAGHFVDPVGLIFGLSVVVLSIFLVTLKEIAKLVIKEAI